jgi:tRNA(Ile)-lysidine synthase
VAFNPQQIIVELIKLNAGRPICVAYSGGVDSHVLLHLLANSHHPELPLVRAVHINHGLNPASADWAAHCREVASQLSVDFESIDVNVEQIDELGVEAAARQARYQAFRQTLDTDEVLVTAQHQQDQAETLMLQLLRGAGPAGLSAMATQTELDELTVIRPFLSVTKDDILHYAELHGLSWIDDPSNEDTRLNRNYLRHEIWPRLSERWPALSETLSRSAAHCREADELLTELAYMDAEQACEDQFDQVSVTALTALSEARQRNLLRYLIVQQGLKLPSTPVLQRIIDEVCPAAVDRNPEVTWNGAMVRRYRDRIYIEAAPSAYPPAGEQQVKGNEPVNLQDGRVIKWQMSSGQGLKPHVLAGGVQLKFRQGGERIRLQGHSQHKSLKQLFQEWSVPPWQREQIPLLFVGAELVAVVGYGYAEHYAADIGEKGWLPLLEEAE